MNERGGAQPDERVDPALDIVGRGMAQWRHERPDIDCSGKAVVGRIVRLQEVILRAFNSGLERYGLRYPAFSVLATLRAAGAPYQLSPSRLRETLLMTSGGTSNLLARLEARGWIRRKSDPIDGRGVIVELTEAGRDLADRAMEGHAEAERALIRMLAPGERDALAAMLSRMLVANDAADAPGHDTAPDAGGLPDSPPDAGLIEKERPA